MADFPGLTLTDAGREIQAKAQTGQTLEFTCVGLGDGAQPESITDLTALVSEQQSLSIQRQQTNGDGTASLRVILTNKGLDTGFFMRELGLFARDPDTQAEALYGYTNAGERPDWLPAQGGATVVEQIFDLITVIGSADNVTAVIDDYITIALKSEVDALRPYIVPNGGTVGQLMEKASNAEGDTRWIDPEIDGIRLNFQSIEEPRTAVANQRVFTLQKTVTNGLAVYVNGERLSREQWAPLSGTQLQLIDKLTAGDAVLFVNNEEVGPSRALDIALDGPTLIYAGSSNDYTLTAFDAFAKISVSASLGTVIRAGDTITLTLPTEITADTVDLTVTRDNVSGTYRIALGDAAIARPEITYPTSGATGIGFEPDLTATDFVVYPGDYDSHASSRWQIATDEAFTSIVFDSQVDANDLTAINVGAAGDRLESARRYYLRVQYQGQTLTSPWSDTVAFNTATIYVRQPRVTSPYDGQINVVERPVLQSDAFDVYGATDKHVTSDWQIMDANDAVVWESMSDAENLTALILPAGVLQEGTMHYKARVRYHGAEYGDSVWSEVVAFVTEDHFLPEPGEEGKPYAGGYYVGRIRSDYDGKEYALVISPASGDSDLMGVGNIRWSTYVLAGADKMADGRANTDAMLGTSYGSPAAQWVEDNCNAGEGLNGYTDWYLPAIDELKMLYRQFKPDSTENYVDHDQGTNENSIPPVGRYSANDPAQTTVVNFQIGGADAVPKQTYIASTETSNTSAYRLQFSNGGIGVTGKTSGARVRAIRRVLIS